MVKIIEAKAIISAQDATGKAFAEIARKIDMIGKATKSFSTSGANDLAKFGKHVEQMNAKVGSIEGFRAQHAALVAARQQFRAAQQDVQRLGKAVASVEKPTKEMTRSYDAAQRSVKQAAAAFQEKTIAVKQARAEMASYGVTLKNMHVQHAEASRVVGRARRGIYEGSGPLSPVPAPLPGAGKGAPHTTPHQPASQAPASGGGSVVPIIPGPAGVVIATTYAAKQAHAAIAGMHHEYQLAYKKQQAILDFSPEQQQPLLDQATKIGIDTRFSQADIVKAQTDIGSKLPKKLKTPATISAITEHTKNYALAMDVSMQEAAGAMVGWMQGRGYDLSSPEAAEKSARRTANQTIAFAKSAGAKHRDIAGDTRFGAAPGRVGGFSEEFSNALSAQLIRLGFEGDKSGTFVRSAAMKLSAPTQKGMTALAASGINLGDYLKPGKQAPSSENLSEMAKIRFGRGFNDDQKARLDQLFQDPEYSSRPADFIKEASQILNESFAKKGQNGKTNAQDAERIAKMLAEFNVLTSDGVDTERLMKDLIKRGMSPAVAKYIFGTDRGGQALSLNSDQLERDQKTYQTVPDDLGARIAAKFQEGAQGDFNKMVGSAGAFTVALGEATEASRSFAYRGIGAIFDSLTQMVQGNYDYGLKPPVDKNTGYAFGKNERGVPMGDGKHFYGYDGYGDKLQKRLNGPFSPKNSTDRFGLPNLTEIMRGPIDVTGKVTADVKGEVNSNIRIKVEGPGTITGQSVTSSGNVRASVGTSTAGDYNTP